MNTLQQLLNQFALEAGCHDWDGYIFEMRQRPEQIIKDFNQIVERFQRICNAQIKELENQLEIKIAKLK